MSEKEHGLSDKEKLWRFEAIEQEREKESADPAYRYAKKAFANLEDLLTGLSSLDKHFSEDERQKLSAAYHVLFEWNKRNREK